MCGTMTLPAKAWKDLVGGAMKGYCRDLIFGLILGITQTVPAISAGTVAVLLNIYDKILLSFRRHDFRKNLAFLLPLGIGCLLGIFFFSKFILDLLRLYETYLYYCFIGMILGSVPALYKQARAAHQRPAEAHVQAGENPAELHLQAGENPTGAPRKRLANGHAAAHPRPAEKIKGRHALLFCAALSLMLLFALVGGGNINASASTLEQVIPLTPASALWLFAAAAISGAAMILPGVSGALVLLILGAYAVALESIASLYFPILLLMGFGALVGVGVGIKFMQKMLKTYPRALYFAILGLIIGSIFTIYPGFTPGKEGALCLLLLALFAGASHLVARKTRKMR